MSVQRERRARITCDIPECETATSWIATDSGPAAWRTARSEGWERGKHGDHLCPEHAVKTREIHQIAELAAQGLRDGQIGARLAIPAGRVAAIRRHRGIPGQPVGRPPSTGAGR